MEAKLIEEHTEANESDENLCGSRFWTFAVAKPPDKSFTTKHDIVCGTLFDGKRHASSSMTNQLALHP